MSNRTAVISIDARAFVRQIERAGKGRKALVAVMLVEDLEDLARTLLGEPRSRELDKKDLPFVLSTAVYSPGE